MDNIGELNSELSADPESPFGVFHDLIRFRVREILLVSSYYDAFVLEEDGRLSERIFGEYIDLNLRFVPRIHRVSTAEEAFRVLEKGRFDLVITMTRITDMDPLEFGTRVKEMNPHIPVVLLTYEWVSQELQEKLRSSSSIDRVFFWSGDTRILLAIIKYIEDLKNVNNDTRLGVRVILLIEDSPKYFSIFLPILYTEIMTQTRMLISEGVNDLHRLLRMRARPKILLAETFEEGLEIYQRYRENLLGVISDIRFPREGRIDKECGFRVAHMIKAEIPDLPFLIQSSNEENRTRAEQFGLDFLNKNSPHLLQEISRFILGNFGFGDFVFRMPDGREVGRAHNMLEFAKLVQMVPDECLEYHAERNHISIWLRARTEFEGAEALRPKRVSDFADTTELRRFIHRAIQGLMVRNRSGVILDFQQSLLDLRESFIRLGNGSLGGKARGIAFLNTMLTKTGLANRFPGIRLRTPHTFVICSEVFETFMTANKLINEAIETSDNQRIVRRFLHAKLPDGILSDLEILLRNIRYPLAVRSSSLLEDSQTLPFAGLYATYMLPNNHQRLSVRMRQLERAIKLVFASVFFSSPKEYVRNTNFRIEEEKMAVIIQQVVGRAHNQRFYPAVSGVAQSFNYYPVSYQKPEDGAVEPALGLGATIVEGARTWRFSPRYPHLPPPYAGADELLKKTQNFFWALSLAKSDINILADERHTLQRLDLSAAEEDGTLLHVGGTYSLADDRITDSLAGEGPRVVTFAPLLKQRRLPLADVLQDVLRTGRSAFGSHVEVEFAMDIPPQGKDLSEFHLLQIRPMVTGKEKLEITLEPDEPARVLCRCEHAMGNGVTKNIQDVVFVDPDTFDLGATRRIAAEVGEINAQCVREDCHYLLIGFGRWGTNDPWLGIPVEWGQISQARVVVEAGRPGFMVDPSQGSHFFHNMISLKMGYFHIRRESEQEYVRWDQLKCMPLVRRTPHVRHVRVSNGLEVRIDGRVSTGVVLARQADAAAR
ncbi:MAG TPA: response regulator [Candidatus Aminicenantes bacterium]|nr:response regulator [Candidatus Aminicenantes bacterium]